MSKGFVHCLQTRTWVQLHKLLKLASSRSAEVLSWELSTSYALGLQGKKRGRAIDERKKGKVCESDPAAVQRPKKELLPVDVSEGSRRAFSEL